MSASIIEVRIGHMRKHSGRSTKVFRGRFRFNAAWGRPSAGGRRTGVTHEAGLPQAAALNHTASMRHQTTASVLPNPSVKRTVNGGPRSAVSGVAVPPLSAAYLQR